MVTVNQNAMEKVSSASLNNSSINQPTIHPSNQGQTKTPINQSISQSKNKTKSVPQTANKHIYIDIIYLSTKLQKC